MSYNVVLYIEMLFGVNIDLIAHDMVHCSKTSFRIVGCVLV